MPCNEETIFEAALQYTDPHQRLAYVAQACGTDAKLRADVESLLQAHASQSLLDEPVLGHEPVCGPLPLVEGPGTVIGRYKLLERIGEGGMAVVYMAEQTEPIRRKVALKIIKLGMDTRQVIARFEAERQALALMDHPSIAKVLDAGATETGRPYFVMELVTGVSITEYCDKNSLSAKDRLALFLQVCHAVQHAHQKGIIHRDIKPSNVMVTHHDGKPVPKVIDFGIAKATNQKLTERTLFTRYAHIIGTPAYMSPEQAQLSDLDIDTRSDIYSLGVLLYELLTGTTPFSEEELRRAGYVEMQRVIREQEPVRPSTKLSTLGETLTDIAKCRNCTPDLLRKAIRGDLDWIVMKSLEKDRVRRYETAGGLAEDIRRHLESEPVLARGPGTAYRLERFLRRHRAQALSVLVMIVVASAGIAVLSLWRQSQRQLAEAEGFRHRDILSQARDQHARGQREAALKTVQSILDSPHVGPEAQLLHGGILVDNRHWEQASAMLTPLLDERPAIAGAAHALLARILWESGSPDAAKIQEIEEHRQKAKALLQEETAEAYFLRAMTALTVKEQLAALDEALQLDPDHYESLRQRAFTYYASRKYRRMRDDALGMTYLRRGDPLGHSLRAIALRELGEYAEAIAAYDRALGLTPAGSPAYLDLSLQRCETFLRMGDYARVISEAQEYLKSSPDKPIFHYYRFCALTALGDYGAAVTVFRQIVRGGQEARGQFEDWCAKYVFDTLEAGRLWRPAGPMPAGAAFLPMVEAEAEETYRALSAKARRLTTDGFNARLSPDGKRLAFSMGVKGYSGVAVFDLATKETELLIVPGKDAAWSPDGKYIAFARDCQALRLEEFATVERRDQHRPVADEEVWVMNADGTQPRRLTRGGLPWWGPDSQHIYYQTRNDGTLYSISLAGQNAAPQGTTKYRTSLPSISPDGQRVAYVEGGSLRIEDLTSQKVLAEPYGPFPLWGGAVWSPTGPEVFLGSGTANSGLWVYNLDRKDLRGVLAGRIKSPSLSTDGTRLAFVLAPPFNEMWIADVDPNVSLVEALGPARTVDEHFEKLVALATRRIAGEFTHPYNYPHRAEHYQSLRDEAKARADVRRYWAALHPGFPPGFRLAGPWSIMQAVNGPCDYQLAFFVERQEDGMVLLHTALGQKGRREMKLFEIPMVVTSLVALGLLPDAHIPAARADFTFGGRQNLGPIVNSRQGEGGPVISRDGLELYFGSNRPGGHGAWDIWRSQRARTEDPWGPPDNLGSGVNSAGDEYATSISSDGLTLYLFAFAQNTHDLYMATRPTKKAAWGPRVNLGPVVNRPGGGIDGGVGTDWAGAISPDDLELFFTSWRVGGFGGLDVYLTTRATREGPWAPPENLGPMINTSGHEFPSAISPDGLILFIVVNRPDGFGDFDTWMIRRPYKGAAWSAPVNLGPTFNTPQGEMLTSISPDGQQAYFSEYDGRPKGDLWMVEIIPPLISAPMKK